MKARLIKIQQSYGTFARGLLELLECGLFHCERFFIALFLSA